MFVYRALNHSKKEFLATYVGLRYLVNQVRSSDIENFISKLVVRKGVDFNASRYRNYTYYKGTNKDGHATYRKCSAASPFALLVEAFVLERLAAQQAFQPPSYVYSYRFPGPRSTSIFRYFYSGYKARSSSIQIALKNNDDSVALLIDIKSFYPSVDKTSVRRSLRHAVSQSLLDRSTERVLTSVTEGYLSGSRTGLPIGPPLSHMFANLALRQLDTVLEKSNQGKYFRYVDDMCFIVPRSRVEFSLMNISRTIEDFGYRVNESKTYVTYEADEFETRHATQEFDMGVLRSSVVIFLSMYPSKVEDVRLATLQAGLNLPINAFSQTSRDIGWAEYVKILFTLRSTPKEVRLARSGIKAIIDYAIKLRNQSDAQLELLANDRAAVVNRRKYVRDTRRLIGILAYLNPIEKIGKYIAYAENFHELKEIEVILRACTTGDIDELLWYPGATANMFSQLWTNSNRPEMKIGILNTISAPQRDVIATLALSGVIRVDPTNTGSVDQRFLNFVSGTPFRGLIRHNGSYDDEISSLRAGSPSTQPTSLTSKALDEKDRIAIFTFGGQYS